MSSLTTPGQGGRGIGDEDDEDVVEVMPGLVPAILPALHSVFDCPNIELCIVKGKSGWDVFGVINHSLMYMLPGLLHTC